MAPCAADKSVRETAAGGGGPCQPAGTAAADRVASFFFFVFRKDHGLLLGPRFSAGGALACAYGALWSVRSVGCVRRLDRQKSALAILPSAAARCRAKKVCMEACRSSRLGEQQVAKGYHQSTNSPSSLYPKCRRPRCLSLCPASLYSVTYRIHRSEIANRNHPKKKILKDDKNMTLACSVLIVYRKKIAVQLAFFFLFFFQSQRNEMRREQRTSMRHRRVFASSSTKMFTIRTHVPRFCKKSAKSAGLRVCDL